MSEVNKVIDELCAKYAGWGCLARNPAIELIKLLEERGIIKILK